VISATQFSSHSEPYVPYSVSVSANSSAGVGESVEVIVFTLDGSMSAHITAHIADRTEATAALVEWEHLSWEDLRGNLSSYEIVCYDSGTEAAAKKWRGINIHEPGLRYQHYF